MLPETWQLLPFVELSTDISCSPHLTEARQTSRKPAQPRRTVKAYSTTTPATANQRGSWLCTASLLPFQPNQISASSDSGAVPTAPDSDEPALRSRVACSYFRTPPLLSHRPMLTSHPTAMSAGNHAITGVWECLARRLLNLNRSHFLRPPSTFALHIPPPSMSANRSCCRPKHLAAFLLFS